jgi:hypothetical protein
LLGFDVEAGGHEPSGGALNILGGPFEFNVNPPKIRFDARANNVHLHVKISAESPEPRFRDEFAAGCNVQIDFDEWHNLAHILPAKMGFPRRNVLDSAMRKLSAFSVLVAIALVGCQASNPLVGKWTTVDTTSAAGGMTMEIDIKDGSNYVNTISIDAMGEKMKMQTSGTYKYENDTLKFTPTKADLLEGPQNMKDSFAKGGSAQSMTPSEMPFKVDGKKATINMGGQTINLEKK